MSVKVLYRTSATANGGRDGRSKTKDGSLDVKLTTPKELGGPGGEGNNPEQLFAAGYSACFLSALKLAASQSGQRISNDSTVTANVGIGPRSDMGFGLEVSLDISLPGTPHDIADKLVKTADQLCPYSHAIRNNVDVKLNILQHN